MKSSQALFVKTNLMQKADIIIHPNEGYDLGVMNTKADVKIFCNSTVEVFNLGDKDFMNGNVMLDNGCKPGTIQLTNKYWKKLGTPERVMLFCEENKILVSNVNEI